mmetsp:Transcript_94060/g.166604  ORF Transcript_94060/g.166604 Transcript_94060/m.166604 type:complete len:372 (-) Transcript_94060:121-1236(-)
MIDFDDLDEEAAARADAGDLDEVAAAALGLPEAPDEYPGGYLWPCPRNLYFPNFRVLPERMQDAFEDYTRHMAQIRLFCFYGAGDSFAAWSQWIVDTPGWVEAVVFEWPSHGTRDEEPHPEHVDDFVNDAFEGLQSALKQHAKGGPLEGAPFALLGHSIGVLIMLGVAKKMKYSLGLEPCSVYVLDRAAPQHRICSDFGYKLLEEEDAQEFIRIFNPQPYFLYEKAKESERGDVDGKAWKMLKMWMDDMKLQNHTKPEGWHQFKCPVHVFVAMQNWISDDPAVIAKMSTAEHKFYKERCSILNSKASGLWDYEMYEDWQSWAFPDRFFVHKLDTDHTTLRRLPAMLEILWKTLDEFKAKEGAPVQARREDM